MIGLGLLIQSRGLAMQRLARLNFAGQKNILFDRLLQFYYIIHNHAHGYLFTMNAYLTMVY